MDDRILLRLRVEDLLYREADLLDRWALDEWLTLYTDDALYLVPPTDIVGDDADPDKALFYVFDDKHRMQERVIRLAKTGAHSEHPKSKVRRLVSNIQAVREGDRITSRASFAVWRSKDVTTDLFVGHYLHELVEQDGELKITKKTCVLDLEALRPQARISIIL